MFSSRPVSVDRLPQAAAAACLLLAPLLPGGHAWAQSASGWIPVGEMEAGGLLAAAPSPVPAPIPTHDLPPASRSESDELRHAFTVFAGKSTPSNFTSIFYEPWNVEFENTYYVSLHGSTLLWSPLEHLDVELEGLVTRRMGNADLWEFSAAVVLRWDDFPWNDTIYTTFGLSVFGPSYATEISHTEKHKSGNGKGSKLLNYFAPEITFSPPDDHSWAFAVRVHHRSGIFGLIDGVSGGSSGLNFGVRYRF